MPAVADSGGSASPDRRLDAGKTVGEPVSKAPGARSNLRHGIRNLRLFLRYLWEEFDTDRGLQVAAELSYTSLLSLVPLMVVAFGLLSAFPVFDTLADKIQDFLFSNFVPTASEAIQQHLQAYAANASRLTGVGMGFLLVTALMMMATIDHSFNHIWKVKVKRSALASFTVYWAVLTLGPVLIGLSLVTSSYLTTVPILSDAAESVAGVTKLIHWTPFLSGTLAFFLLYMVVPNRRVGFRNALAGGILAASLFELAKKGFTFYITNFPTYENIYGAMAVIPIFLIWIYLSWLIALLGAEFTHCLPTFKHWVMGSRRCGSRRDFLLAYRILGYLWQAQTKGRVLSDQALLAREPALNEHALLQVLTALRRAGLIYRSEVGHSVLNRDLGELTLYEFYRAMPYALPLSGCGDDPWNRALQQVLDRAFGGLRQTMTVPLKTLYKAADAKSVSTTPVPGEEAQQMEEDR